MLLTFTFLLQQPYEALFGNSVCFKKTQLSNLRTSMRKSRGHTQQNQLRTLFIVILFNYSVLQFI